MSDRLGVLARLMSTVPLLPLDKQTAVFKDIWKIFRTCELNVLFHRRRAKRASRRAKSIDIAAALLAAIAGVGILSDVPTPAWAVLAFFSGLVGQLRSVFGLGEAELEHRNLQEDYSSVLSALSGLIDRTKNAGGLTTELETQRQLIFERFHCVKERDWTDIPSKEVGPLQDEINETYPPDSLWMPSQQQP